MATEAELQNLRVRADSILRTQACNSIHFRVDNVTINSYMTGYIGHAILKDRVHLTVDSDHTNNYDHRNDTINFYSLNEPSWAIVHESIHAVIDATHGGKTVTVGTGEAVAYIAETVYALNAGLTSHTIDDHRTMSTAYRIAKQIRAYNASGATGVYTVPQGEVDAMKAALMGSNLRQDFTQGFVQNGIYEGPKRGIIGMMYLEDRKK